MYRPKELADLYRYAVRPDFIERLLTLAESLFDWQMPDLPEDPALYRVDGSLLLETVAHEGMGTLTLRPEEMACILKNGEPAWLRTIRRFSLGIRDEWCQATCLDDDSCVHNIRVVGGVAGVMVMVYDDRWRLVSSRACGSMETARWLAQREFGIEERDWEVSDLP